MTFGDNRLACPCHQLSFSLDVTYHDNTSQAMWTQAFYCSTDRMYVRTSRDIYPRNAGLGSPNRALLDVLPFSVGPSFLLARVKVVFLTSSTTSRDLSSSNGTWKTEAVEPKRQSSVWEVPNNACSEHENGVVVVIITEVQRRSALADGINKEAIEAKKKTTWNLDICRVVVVVRVLWWWR